jgi:putative transposase
VPHPCRPSFGRQGGRPRPTSQPNQCLREYIALVPSNLRRYQNLGTLHFITFSCYRRQPFLNLAPARRVFVDTLERVRNWYGLCVWGYVVMPEHVHLLVSEPERSSLAVAIQMLKQITAKTLLPTMKSQQFWQARYYDFNVCTEKKRVEKLRYIHRNPVNRGLVESPEDWAWSSFRQYLTGEQGVVELTKAWAIEIKGTNGLLTTAEPRLLIPPCRPKEGRQGWGHPSTLNTRDV